MVMLMNINEVDGDSRGSVCVFSPEGLKVEVLCLHSEGAFNSQLKSL